MGKYHFTAELSWPVLGRSETVLVDFWAECDGSGDARKKIKAFAKQYKAQEISLIETTKHILLIDEPEAANEPI